MESLVLLTGLLILAIPSFAQTPERRAEIGTNAPVGKLYIYKHSDGNRARWKSFSRRTTIPRSQKTILQAVEALLSAKK